MASSPPEVVFSSDVPTMHEWSRRTGIPLISADAIGVHYARARAWLQSIRNQLVQQYGWRDVLPLDERMLFSIECQPPTTLPRSPNFRLQAPRHASSLFNPDRRVQWEMVFHGAVFPYLRHTVPPIADLLYLFQCLLTGVFLLVKEDHVPGEGTYRTIRGLPPVEWVAAHEADLIRIFGVPHYRALFRAAGDKRTSFKLEHAR